MSKLRKITGFLLAGVLLIAGLTGCSEKSVSTGGKQEQKNEKKIVKLGFPGKANFIYGIAGLAQEKKFIDEELSKIGYSVEYVPFAAAGPAVNEALASKKIDVAIYGDFPGVVIKSKGVDTTLLGIVENNLNATIVVKNDSSITSVKQLKGKKIGFTKGTYLQKYLLELLKANGLSEKDVQFINVTTEGESALISGNLDALVQTDSDSLQLTITKKVAKEIDTTRNHPEWSAQFIFVGEGNYVKENPEVAVAINKGLLNAKKYFKENQEESYKVLTKLGLTFDGVKKLYSKKEEFSIGIPAESIKKLEGTQKFLLDQGLIKNSFDVSKWADNSYYEKALK